MFMNNCTLFESLVTVFNFYSRLEQKIWKYIGLLSDCHGSDCFWVKQNKQLIQRSAPGWECPPSLACPVWDGVAGVNFISLAHIFLPLARTEVDWRRATLTQLYCAGLGKSLISRLFSKFQLHAYQQEYTVPGYAVSVNSSYGPLKKYLKQALVTKKFGWYRVPCGVSKSSFWTSYFVIRWQVTLNRIDETTVYFQQ